MRRQLIWAALLGSMMATSSASASGYTATRYPIVLAHGMAGFDELFGVYDYWFGIPGTLRRDGARVFVTEVPQFNSTALRGAALLDQIEEILAVTGAGKVNLIGHSHGGLDVRWVAANAPQLVASVTTVGTPHQGADLADFLRNNVSGGSFTEVVLSFFANSLGSILALISGSWDNPQDAIAALDSLTTAGAAAFNASYPLGLPTTPCGEGPRSVNGIYYYSWSGDRALTNILDPSDALLALTSLVYNSQNDGLVESCSSHFGRVIRDDYRLNHLDEVNQVSGLVHLFGPDPKSLFRTHANRLKNEGL